ncbi:MAG TPA: hypothetical protein VGR55_18610 [Candidatus Acidoferrum sp.]|nr:hypothetical protein [Candidatus Acidoferrum sp.]
MAFFRHYELRGTHDWNNPLRPYIDGFELIVLLSMLFFGLFYAVEGIHSGPIWNFFTSWGAFFHLVVGLCLTVAALLLLRDWEYAIAEREEERRQHKQWQEERDRIAQSGL